MQRFSNRLCSSSRDGPGAPRMTPAKIRAMQVGRWRSIFSNAAVEGLAARERFAYKGRSLASVPIAPRRVGNGATMVQANYVRGTLVAQGVSQAKSRLVFSRAGVGTIIASAVPEIPSEAGPQPVSTPDGWIG